jgi:hypothetical protein
MSCIIGIIPLQCNVMFEFHIQNQDRCQAAYPFAGVAARAAIGFVIGAANALKLLSAAGRSACRVLDYLVSRDAPVQFRSQAQIL